MKILSKYSLLLLVVIYSCKPEPSTERLQGFDISHHKGKIDWTIIDTSQFQFALIKSSEGSDFLDTQFSSNMEGAKKMNIPFSATHRFSLLSTGEKQFDYYKKIVPKNMPLPPSIDLFGLYNCPPNKRDSALNELKILEDLLEKHYQKKPILYGSVTIYDNFIKDNFNNIIWLQDFGSQEPQTLKNCKNYFWQYSIQGKVKGIQGDVDLNYFKGTKKDLLEL
jgi:lysozyme